MSATQARDLKTILTEMTSLQNEYKGKPMPQNVGEKFEALGAEAKTIQDEQDREKKMREIDKASREVIDPAMPATKSNGTNTGDIDIPVANDDVVGYVRLGKAFTNSREFKQYLADGKPLSGSAAMIGEGASIKHTGIPVTRAMLREAAEAKAAGRETKAVLTVGAGVLRTDRQTEVVRFAERDRLTVRDLLQVLPTNASSVDWVTLSSWTDAAGMVAESGLKPEATGALGSGTAPVRTIAEHIPVTEQQLDDVPQIEALIDDELRYGIRFREEQQVLWGDGTAQNLLGIFPTPGVSVGRTVGGDTTVDLIRRMMTDVAVAGLEPNGLVIDPLDWEGVVLTKGTDGHYLYQTFPDATGALRVWGLTPVETIAVRNPAGTPTTRERRVLVGDFRRSATLWDRRQLNVAVGYINDQFVRNQRTIRAEERVAFAVKRAAGFRYRITQAAVV